MDGGDRAGYLQMSGLVDSNIITSTMGATTCVFVEGWAGFRVISSEAAVAAIVATGIGGSSLITSAVALEKNAILTGKITSIGLSADSTGHKVQAYRRVLL